MYNALSFFWDVYMHTHTHTHTLLTLPNKASMEPMEVRVTVVHSTAQLLSL